MRILIAEDDNAIRITLVDDLKAAGHDVAAVLDGAGAALALEGENFDCAILDIRMPGADGVDLMKEIRSRSPETEVILMTGHGTMESVLEALRTGAYDYILKPFDNEVVVMALKRMEELRTLRRENMILKRTLDQIKPPRRLVGKSQGMSRVYETIRNVAPTTANILVIGESGTGKELVADEIHLQSERRNGPLVKFSCAALPESLIEAELFGHEKGAFTGAYKSKPGRFQMASGGTIFLDDVDDVPMTVQAKLLRCLEEGEIWPVGGQPLKVDIRIVAATKIDLLKAAKRGAFREDLYFRLNVIQLDLPPLRARADDIPLLVDHFVRLHGVGRHYDVDSKTMERMISHSWPGNVRELENSIERAIAMAGDSTQLHPEHLFYLATGHRSNSASGSLANAVANAERERITSAIKASDGKRGEAARILGISRKTLWEKMKKLKVQAEEIE